MYESSLLLIGSIPIYHPLSGGISVYRASSYGYDNMLSSHIFEGLYVCLLLAGIYGCDNMFCSAY